MTNEEKKAIEILEEFRTRNLNFLNVTTLKAMGIVVKALEQTSWTPVSEGLPKETGSYLVTIGFGNDKDAVAFRYYYADIKAWSGTYITAWMPKPQPYKECDKNDNNKV